jgi:integrase
MKVNSAPRGILTPEEAREVLMKPGLWNNPTAFLANLLAACTGMRAGEIQALRAMDFTETSIIVEHSWVERYQKLKCTKTGIVREIPIHPMLRGVLLSGKLPTDFIFTMEGRDRPIYRSCLLDNLRRALERSGISRQEQKERNICFHSWRHYLNTRMRVAGIPDVVTRQVTGHTTEEMTERYTHISADDAIGVLALQSALMPKRPADESDGARCEIIPPSETAC